MSNLDALLGRLWRDYRDLNSQVDRIHKLLEGRGEKIVNDHIALRTFEDPRIGLDAMGRKFESMGYKACEDYRFEEKKLKARHFEHPAGTPGTPGTPGSPGADVSYPRVFISELELGRCSANLRRIVAGLVGQLDDATCGQWDLPMIGRPWRISRADYQMLADESEYAGWVAAFGFRANHFTVLVNALKTFASLEQLNDFLKANGFALNSSGGEIKGSPKAMLEQSSTLADIVPVPFSDGIVDVPCCYYEFARRYPMADGSLFSGFVTRSADRIFESTNRRDSK